MDKDFPPDLFFGWAVKVNENSLTTIVRPKYIINIFMGHFVLKENMFSQRCNE